MRVDFHILPINLNSWLIYLFHPKRQFPLCHRRGHHFVEVFERAVYQFATSRHECAHAQEPHEITAAYSGVVKPLAPLRHCQTPFALHIQSRYEIGINSCE